MPARSNLQHCLFTSVNQLAARSFEPACPCLFTVFFQKDYTMAPKNLAPFYEKARKLAKIHGESFAIIDIEADGHCRYTEVHPETYCDSIEFEMFDGRILDIVD